MRQYALCTFIDVILVEIDPPKSVLIPLQDHNSASIAPFSTQLVATESWGLKLSIRVSNTP